MTKEDLIGKVAILYLKERLIDEKSIDGTARYLLDCLTAKQTASIASTILKDSKLCDLIEIKLPHNFLAGYSLPEKILTEERTTFFRNADCEKKALLLATTGDDEQQSLKDMTPIGSSQLLGHTHLWIKAVNPIIGLDDTRSEWWEKALRGLLEVQFYDLDIFASYVLETTAQITTEGEPLLEALGLALPALRIPRDKTFFNVLNEKNASHLEEWKRLYRKVIQQRSYYLKKYSPTQNLLTQSQLATAFEKVKESIPQNNHECIEKFIAADSGWNNSSEELSLCEWENISPLFDGLKKEKFNLGAKTIEFYDEHKPTDLNDDDNSYLETLKKRCPTTNADPLDEEFYKRHRSELKDDDFLKAKWDQFIFGKPVECEDLLVGITTCLENLFDRSGNVSKKQLVISSNRKTKSDLGKLNFEAGEYFAFRYKGLPKRLGDSIEWDTGELFNFHTHLASWRKESNSKLNRSYAKKALRINFFLSLKITQLNGSEYNITRQLVWKFNPDAVAAELSRDWGQLNKYPIRRCYASRENISGKSNVQSIDLTNSKTLHANYAKNRGSFVPAYKEDDDLAIEWEKNLQHANSQGLINDTVTETIRKYWNVFKDKYTNSIQNFFSVGFLTKDLREQGHAYGSLLNLIYTEAKGDVNRQLLLHPLMKIGVAQIVGNKVTAIVTPWNPLRLLAMDVKIEQISKLLSKLLSTDEHQFSDACLYFKELIESLLHPYYPELVIGWDKLESKLLALTDHNLDYSLHENPLAEDDGLDETNESPEATASLVQELIKKYLNLYPHEKANFSTVLYDCDSSRLPIALVNKVAKLHEDDDDMRCEVILRHRDKSTLIDLYERIIDSSDADVDSFVASEATTDFMARLRIGIMTNQTPKPDAIDGRPTDIVFLQDVIARHAEVEWYNDKSLPMNELDLYPSQWSKHKLAAIDGMNSVVYLTCPMQTETGWNYINALSYIMKPHMKEYNDHLLPARQLNFNDSRTAEIFEEIHELGNWVVNYDELLDRRQLSNQQVRVIRYKKISSQGRNLLISSKAPLGLLKSMVKKRIANLSIDTTTTNFDLDSVVGKFIDDANTVSGDLVLRAAKRGRNASELMGVVLSKYLVEDELGNPSSLGWFFLDDYAEWLGQKEEQIADLMALLPIIEEDTYKLGIIVSEVKYIDHSSLSSKCKESQNQLRDTVRRMRVALFNEPECMDRELWLSRLSNLVMSGIHNNSKTIDIVKWRDAFLKNKCELFIRGYSHVFVSGPSDCPECSDFTVIANLENAYQEVFSRTKVRKILLAYSNKESVMQIRNENANNDAWNVSSWHSSSKQKIRLALESNKDEITKNNADSEKEKQPLMTTESNSMHTAKNNFFSKLINNLHEKFPVDSQQIQDDQGWLEQIVNRCKGALQQFELKAKLINSRLTPNCALLKFEGSSNLTVEKVRKRQSEFLTSHGLNITSINAEPSTVSISIGRPEREILLFQNVWRKWEIENDSFNTSLLIGIREEDGSPLFFSPQKNAPHTLIAGSTGSGKSILMQNIILGIVATNEPKNAEIVIIDPKMVDYQNFKSLPHVKEGIIDDMDHAIRKFEYLIDEMDRRYSVLKKNQVKNINNLNIKDDASEKLPYIWVIHDEFAEWMMTDKYKEAITKTVGRLGVKARAAGIFLIFAAQRPEAQVMPLQLRSQLGNRLVLRVDSVGTSEIALGEKGSERLMGNGHLAARLEGENDIVYAQVPFIGDDQIEFLVSQIASRNSSK